MLSISKEGLHFTYVNVWLYILSVFTWEYRYIYSLEVQTITEWEFGKENFCWKYLVPNPAANLARSWPDCLRVLEKWSFATALYPARNLARLRPDCDVACIRPAIRPDCDVTPGSQLWLAAFSSFLSCFWSKISSFCSLLDRPSWEKNQENSSFSIFNFCSNLEF